MQRFANTSTPVQEKQAMRDASVRIEKPAMRRWLAGAAFAAVALLCAGHAELSFARSPGTRTFATAEGATQALYGAVERNDLPAITTILGAGKGLVSSNDKVQDNLDRARFLQKYRQMHRLVREPDATTVLYIGAENWPFPIPLVSESGAWHFDGQRGMEEVLFRRIGENELSATQACHALVLAQKEHRWPERDPAMRSLRSLAGRAADPGVAFHGYFFRALASRGAVDAPGTATAYVAYPAVYGSTGVMTYLVDQDDVVYAKDLGPETSRVARRMTESRRDSSWHPED
jgi:Protein of unknown function (DUF2950)